MNPFEDHSQQYLTLVNDEGQFSLWPAFKAVPDGWTAVIGPSPRETCLSYITENWSDMRPKSLRTAMD